jgi:hypothetical protein
MQKGLRKPPGGIGFAFHSAGTHIRGLGEVFYESLLCDRSVQIELKIAQFDCINVIKCI